MRFFGILLVFLGACTSHEIRCAAHLSPINPPVSSAGTPEAAVPLRPARADTAPKAAHEVSR